MSRQVLDEARKAFGVSSLAQLVRYSKAGGQIMVGNYLKEAQLFWDFRALSPELSDPRGQCHRASSGAGSGGEGLSCLEGMEVGPSALHR